MKLLLVLKVTFIHYYLKVEQHIQQGLSNHFVSIYKMKKMLAIVTCVAKSLQFHHASHDMSERIAGGEAKLAYSSIK
jgi:hypothetical protein